MMKHDGKQVLYDSDATQPGDCDLIPVLSILEQQLVRLDRMGATIAAAHLDAAIQQLRIDQAERRQDGQQGATG